MTTIKGFKLIQSDMKSKNGNHTWELMKWYSYPEKDIKLCNSGFHACKKANQAMKYIYRDKFFLIEAKGKIIYSPKRESDPKFVASEMRLVKELPLKEISVKYACASARLCLKNYEKKYPNDKRPSEAIQAAEDYMDKKIDLTELNSKLSAAESAARSAESAARSAESAAWSAESAAWSAESAAWSAESAARSAESAARSARSAAWSAESAARSAESAARSAESATWSARSATWSAESAAWSAESATWSARSATWSAESATWSAARSALNKIFDKIVKEYI